MSHYYDKDCNLVEADLRQAKKQGLFPSVTTILYILDKYGLNQWKIRNAVMSALTLPKVENESDDDYVNRIVADSEEIGKKASSKGTEVHDMVEQIVGNKAVFDDPIYDSVSVFMSEYKLDTIYTEKVFVHPFEGLGCRIDWYGKTIDGYTLIDWKTQDVKEGKFTKYPEWAYQLAGNSICMAEELHKHNRTIDAYWNVIISVNKDSYAEMKIIKWDVEEMNKYKNLFLTIRKVYKYIKNL